MRDLTVGAVEGHIVRMAMPIAAGMLFQALFYMVDLYFVAHLGAVAIAGVAAAGNVVFLIMALTQVIAAGTLALLSQAVGRKHHDEANLVFNQASSLAALFGAATLVFGYPLCRLYLGGVAADGATMAAGITYLACYLPGLATQFAITAMSTALRATGIVQPAMIVQAAAVLLNIVLAPILIAGWGTGHPLGVAGAGLATTISVIFALLLLTVYFVRLESYVAFSPTLWRPRLAAWRRIVMVGLPAGGEIAFIFVYTAIVFALIRHFGDAAQAGFGVGMRLMQAIFMPGMAIAFAAAPVAGQNFGAGQGARVRATLRASVVFCSLFMLALTLLCQMRPEWLVQGFTKDPDVIAQGVLYLRVISWNFVASGIIYSCSAMFQALGNAWPSLVSTGSRLFTFVLPASWMATWPHYRIEDLWYLSVVTVALQAATSLFLLWREFRRKLPMDPPAMATLPGAVEF